MGQKTKKRARAREAVVTTKEKVEMRKAIKKKVKWEFPLLRQNYLILAVRTACYLDRICSDVDRYH